ncbi:DUF3349 domain-containing protein [Mycobacterium shinjukuense]|uniref:Uncharacterized protein n=1 Tax=Mycobacterium shinjukuense TaxID=398694 RepID=A0A7I7MK90_9MYCO|nr:DUF3349 domain-containing protein [Mycobacterium shinjukuense]MCV6985494.1 DUF3349 domain-containing protein [Mycobacterium shinjukuense]ORB66553.1 endonuclease [Mycobacterium shinjukuense]BBX72731.1 hypothetical protein MSHI_06370 [Mycobacterium shinjukuense]
MTKTFSHPHFLRSVIRWLQVGYPEGVPGPDRVALLALLRSTPLTEEQVREVVRHLTSKGSPAIADGVIHRDEIGDFISGVTHHDAGPENIQRVAGVLAAAGWPLAGVEVNEAESEGAQAAASQA